MLGLFCFFFFCVSIKEKRRVPVVLYSIILLLLRYMVDAKFKLGENF